MTFSGQPLTASMLEIDLSSSPLYPKARRGGGAYASTEFLLGWIRLRFAVVRWHFFAFFKSPWQKYRREYIGGQQGKINFLHSSSHAGPLLARFRGETSDPRLGPLRCCRCCSGYRWLTIMIILALRVSNFRCSCAIVRVDQVRTGSTHDLSTC